MKTSSRHESERHKGKMYLDKVEALLNILVKENSPFHLVCMIKFSYGIAITNSKNYMDFEISGMYVESQLHNQLQLR